ncbi:MAG: YraN family protein [Luteolibacter sp.]
MDANREVAMGWGRTVEGAAVGGVIEGRVVEHGGRAARVRAKDELGRYGEQLAARELVRAGMTVLDRNWRCDAGEIDLVLREGSTLVVCEVKTRTSTAYGTPLEAVDWRKVARLHTLAGRWASEHRVRARQVRVDAVGILAPPGRPAARSSSSTSWGIA